jgi:mRNA turnover protein 4
MPKSKRKRNAALTKTEGKGAQLKMDLVEKVRDSVDNYKFLYVFSYENMRTNMFKKVRQQLKESRLFLGKNKVMQVALGRSEEEEYGDELMKISKHLSGNRGLLFSDTNVEAMKKIFDNSAQQDFARAGNVATETVQFEEGPLSSMPHNMDEPLRKLGMPVMLKKGVVTLIKPFTVCEEGEALTPEQARILKHFNYKLAEFKLSLSCYWSEGVFHEI